MKANEWLQQLLEIMVDKEASDLLVSVNAPPTLKMAGQLIPLGDQVLSPAQVAELVKAALPPAQRERFASEQEANFALSLPGRGRFRVSAFQQRNQPAMVLRRISFEIPRLETLKLPATLGELAGAKRGLVLVVGGTGTGKSTTLASMIQQRNETQGGHIISIEDPIEYVHPHKKAIINQREVGIDTESFEVALKNTLRQAPDVILIGEIRTRKTMEHALTFAETGHLCLATLHANNANQALDRIINFFPSERHDQVWLDLSLNLKAIVAQQLLPTQDRGRRAAIEIMLRSPLIGDLIRKGEVAEIKDVMRRSRDLGMQTFDQALYELYQEGVISEDIAMVHADSANDLRMMIKFGDEGGVADAQGAASHLELRRGDDF
ncbi:twitching motility protein PilU [Onishia taeanensis]|uniref:Twitching motility protein PilU n=1 Tax=Onishia taeanensis TaxID=284577 RepID=A0A328XM37_9GAMM|nr:PilT/PilU family type 4a pilus ATPase [Halomonas taeanensis]RAR58521.1 twitching motility protein PilU [Halomonas taeanensis]